jgi:hypothetical protein
LYFHDLSENIQSKGQVLVKRKTNLLCILFLLWVVACQLEPPATHIPIPSETSPGPTVTFPPPSQTPKPTFTPLPPTETVIPTVTPLPSGDFITLVFQNGDIVRVYDWQFLYTFGEFDTEPEPNTLYFRRERYSQDLYLQRYEILPKVMRTDVIISGKNLRRIIYEYEPEKEDGLEGFIFLTDKDPIYIKQSQIRISVDFFSDKPYIYAPTIELIGYTYTASGIRQELKIGIFDWHRKTDPDALVRVYLRE